MDYSKTRSILILAILLVISNLIAGCKNSKKTEPDGALTVIGVGSVNFSKVPIGEVRQAGIKIDNQTDKSYDLVIPMTSLPFSYNPSNSTCGQKIAPKTSCIYAIRFSPITRNNFVQNISILGTTITFTGQGTDSGVLEIAPTSWDMGQITAGDTKTLRVTLKNSGDQRIIKPTITHPYINSGGSNCLEYILPSVTCYIDLVFQKTSSGAFSETAQLKSSDTIFSDLLVTASIVPGSADGLILFASVPQFITTDGVEELEFSVSKVPDIYGNIVSDGTACTLGGSNVVFPNGNNFTTTNGGATIRIRSTALRENVVVTASCFQAYGFVSIKPKSLPASGPITVSSFNSSVRADGIAGVNIRTNPIRDPNGNIINDGDKVYFFLSGGGTLDKTESETINGQAQVRVTSSTSAGTAYLEIRANPIYTGGVITSWGAYSDPIAINYVSGYPEGDFPISCDNPSIYRRHSQNKSYQNETICNIGPLVDGFGNPAGSNKLVTININGGFNKFTMTNSFSITTGSDSTARFTIVSDEQIRGYIDFSATVNTTEKTFRLFVADEMTSRYVSGLNNISLYKAYGSSQSSIMDLLPISNYWSKIFHDLASIESIDDLLLGMKSYSQNTTQLLPYTTVPLITHFDCLTNIGEYTNIAPCFTYSLTNGNYFWGNLNSYTIGYNKDLGMLRTVNNSKEIGAIDAHGSANILGNVVTYHQGSDSYILGGGFSYTTPSSSLISNSNLSILNYPSGLLSQLDVLNYNKASYLGSTAFASSYSRGQGDAYSYGGLTISLNPTNTLVRYKKSNGILPESEILNIDNHDTLGAPLPTIFSALYVDEANNYFYTIGGYKKEFGNWSANDEIWRVNLSSQNKKWERICSSCSLPIADNTSFFTFMGSLSASTNKALSFADLMYQAKTSKIAKLSDNTLAFITRNSTAYRINLLNGSTSIITENPLNVALNADSVAVNPISGRIFSARNDYANGISRIYYYEVERGKKPYYMIEHTLEPESHIGVQKLNFKIAAYAESRDDNGIQYGLLAEVYNRTSNRWDYLGQNDAQNESESRYIFVTRSLTSFTGALGDYVNEDGKVFIRLSPLQSAGCQTGTCINNSVNDIRINYSEITGVW